MNITKLKGILPEKAYTALEAALPIFPKLDSNKKLAHLLGQSWEESGGFTVTVENLNYSAGALLTVFKKYFPDAEEAALYARQPEKIANKVYADRMGNGNSYSGEGWKYRGRGYLQLTGKANYKLLSDALGVDLVTNPDLVSTTYAMVSAAFFFEKNNLWPICDTGISTEIITTVTKRVNGGTTHLENRIKHTNDIYNILIS